MEYVELLIKTPLDEDFTRDLLITDLGELGFDSFLETEEGFNAYIPAASFQWDMVSALLDQYREEGIPIQSFFQTIPGQNWNAEWENHFQPVEVEDKVYIRAPFHSPQPQFPHELVIIPKMSFGTGHHATTWLMVREMLDVDFMGKHVLDMGSGTGILGIFAANRGATQIMAIDNDPWSFENAPENVERNQARGVEVVLGDFSSIGDRTFDVILANITLNILLENLPTLTSALRKSGHILFSGILAEQAEMLVNAALEAGLSYHSRRERNNWLMIHFLST